MSKRKRIITSILMGSAVAAFSATAASAALGQNTQSTSPKSSDLLAQTPPPPPPTQQPLVPNPNITIDGVTPTPGVGLMTPTVPRAVAPPVGDISVSNLDASMPTIDLGSSARINMVLKNTPAREVLESLARSANLNLAYSDSSADGKAKPEATVSLNLRNEPVQNAFNYVLQLSGLEANRVGNTIFVGTRLPDSVRETIVRTLRMNQVTSSAAANFLTSQGAETQIATTKVSFQSVGEGAAARTVEVRTPEILALKASDTSTGTLLLKGLSVTTDERLNAITLVGSPRKVEMATSMLTRLDARRRQVALNVKIVDVNLSNANSMSNSLSFKAGDGFLSVDSGAAVYNYGGYNPASKQTVLSSFTTPPVTPLNLPGGNGLFLDYQPGAPLSNQSGIQTSPANGLPTQQGLLGQGNIPRSSFGTTSNPYQPGVTAYTAVEPIFNLGTRTFNTGITNLYNAQTGAVVRPGEQLSDGSVVSPFTGQVVLPGGQLNLTPKGVATYSLPSNIQYPTKFLSTLQAQIISGNGKILTDPTLVVQEGQRSTVNLTQQVFGGFKINSVAGTGATTSTREPIINNAGLSLEILVNRIDDNGFVSVGVTPTVSSIGATVTTADGDISLLQSRTMNSGEIRLRDGQTLILSGIIQESDRTSVSKVPILGDIPILGALFRSTNKSTARQEVVVLLTPQILDDNKTQVNYTPGVDARLMIGR